MNKEAMNLKQLADYLHRDARDLERMANRSKIPARKVGGEWRFERAEVVHWLETRLEALSDQELSVLESSGDPERVNTQLLVRPLMSSETMAIPIRSKSPTSVIRELVEAADRSGQVYQPELIRDAVFSREKLHSTALDCGVAIPHWRRPIPNSLGESLLVYGQCVAGIPFGGERGCLTNHFFLVLCRDDRSHLHVIARLARLIQLDGFIRGLAEAQGPDDVLDLVEQSEKSAVG